MSEDKRKTARTQGRYSDGDQFSSKRRDKPSRFSGGDSEYSSRRYDKQKNSQISSVDKGEKRKAPAIGSRAQNEMDLQYEEDDKYSFKNLEHVKKPTELRFFEPILELSKTENGTSRLLYDPDFMKLGEAGEYMTILESSIKWYDKNIVIKGVEYPQPRLVAWFGPHPYTYAGATLDAKQMPNTILEIKEKAEATLRRYNINVKLNSVLLNLYRNGKDSVAWHSDDELSLGINPTIVSVSLGETRRFEMRPKGNIEDLDTNEISYVNLTHGSLIVMDGCMQQDWLHRVPKEFHDRNPRINLTFRTIHEIDEFTPGVSCVTKKMSVKSSSTNMVPQQDHKYEEENFPPLGSEINGKKPKSFPTANNSRKLENQKRKPQKEVWDDEMIQNDECPEETPRIPNNLNENSSCDPVINSPELHPSQTDFNSNIKKESSEFCEFQSNNLETCQSQNCNPNDAYELKSKNPSSSEIKSDPDEVFAKTADSEKKYMLNADAPDFVPQNKFERYYLSELADYTSCVKTEELPSFVDALFKSVYENLDSLFIQRDSYELDAYSQLIEAGSLTDKHLKIIAERVCSMIKNAMYKKNDPRYSRNSNRFDDKFHRNPRQSYTKAQRR